VQAGRSSGQKAETRGGQKTVASLAEQEIAQVGLQVEQLQVVAMVL
jgi:hypothetical protein